jgi:hypothetical protein
MIYFSKLENNYWANHTSYVLLASYVRILCPSSLDRQALNHTSSSYLVEMFKHGVSI